MKDIKLKVEKGDVIGIVGPIGGGKTCLLNAILNNLDVIILYLKFILICACFIRWIIKLFIPLIKNLQVLLH